MKKKWIRQSSYIFVFFLCFVSFPLLANPNCENAFSRLNYENRVLADLRAGQNLQPDFLNIHREVELVQHWNQRPQAPALLTVLLPKDVHFINHQLYKAEAPTVIKNAEIGEAIMARAHWEHKINDNVYTFASNVSFSVRALTDNLQLNKQNWLVSEKAKAAVFYFHGGGTMTTGSHTANAMTSHFKKYGIDVVAVDLPWHAEGHRHFLNNLELEIEVLGSFARKFIPPNVPLFVAGHSWGGVFAEKIMRMSDRPKADFHFHPKLTGAIILSTGLTDLSGIRNYFDRRQTSKKDLSLAKVYEESSKISEEVLTKRVDEFPPDEMDILTDMVSEGKISPLGGLYAKIMFQMSQEMPTHKGDRYIPSLMVVGMQDALVRLGFEKEYEIYKELSNVHAVYLEELPTLFDRSMVLPTGHMLGNRLSTDLPVAKSAPVHWVEMRKFIARVLNLHEMSIERQNEIINLTQMIPQNKKEQIQLKRQLTDIKEKQKAKLGISSSTPDIVHIVQYYAMDMAFRKWLHEYLPMKKKETADFVELKTKTQVKLQNQIKYHLIPKDLPPKRVPQLLHILADPIIISVRDFDILKPIQSEIDTLVQTDSANRIQTNTNVEQDLIQLRGQIKKALDTHLVSDLEEIAKTARAIQNTHKEWLILPSRREQSRHQRAIRSIFVSKSRESADEFLLSMNLSTETQADVSKLLDTYFENHAILGSTYIPNIDLIKKQGIKKGRESKITDILNSLSNMLWNQSQYEQEYREVYLEYKNHLAEEHNNLLSSINHYISVVKHFLKHAHKEPPISLKEDYRQSEIEFQKLMSNYFETEKTMDQIASFVFEKQQPAQHFEISSYTKDKESSKQFIALYKQYVQNREVLNKKTISAIEAGEMGEQAQQAVIKLYGYGSNGEHPRIGSKSLYLKYEDSIKKLGQLESKIRSLDEVMMAEQRIYNESMNALLTNIESPHTGIRKASNMFDTSNEPVADIILNGKINHIDPNKVQTDPHERQRALDILNRNLATFTEVMKQWNRLKSSLPPLLPTER